MVLDEYARKRKFDKTPEPPATKTKKHADSSNGFYCVQRHDASRLHYDFRLEVDGVLVSWAVPKGPSLDPARKALAMKVEDHPLDYGQFEGNIPSGNYGAGSVMLWDVGSYQCLGDLSPAKQIERGDFKFALAGKKLKGSFAIVRMKGRGKGNEWLLIKKPDEYATTPFNIDDYEWSVASRRTQAEIADDTQAITPASLSGAVKQDFPAKVNPMMASLSKSLPQGERWMYEVKWDGVRALCFVSRSKVTILSRKGSNIEQQYPELQQLAKQLSVSDAVLDGEICVLDEQGRSHFALIQPRISGTAKSVRQLSESDPVTLFLFDILHADGYDLTRVKLEDRKRLLQTVVSPNDRVKLSQPFDTDGQHMFAAAQELGLEGVLAKDRASTYDSGGRSRAWVKVKVLNEQEFVIAGYLKGQREYFGALVLGVYQEGELRHVGQVGTGFDNALMQQLHEKLAEIRSSESPLSPKPRLKDVQWVRPELVCQIQFQEWTRDGILRGAVFAGLRKDKSPADVIREEATVASEAVEDERLSLSGEQLKTEVNGRCLQLTNLGKLFFPKDGWKKRDLIGFYDRVAHLLLPHLRDRPLSLKRYPNGIEGQFFFQKNAAKSFPSWLRCEPIQESKSSKVIHYVFADDRASLLYLANLGCIDQNPSQSRLKTLKHPDWMLIDLDPVEAPFERIVEAAHVVHELLNRLRLKSFPKTTGGDGLHVYVPLDPIYTYDQVRSFAEIIAQLAVQKAPDLFTTPRSVQSRKRGRVYFDWMQIGSHKTIAAPYVLRAYDRAPVATPLAWSEVQSKLKPDDFRIDNAPARFEKKGDLFAAVLEGGQRIEKALQQAQDEMT